MKNILVFLLSTSVLLAQSTINFGTQGHNADFSGYNATKPMTVGSTLPATCQIGQLFFSTTAPAGQNIFGCTSTNVWTVQSGGSNGVSPLTSVQVSATSVTFPTTTDGTSAPIQNVTLTNVTTTALAVTSVTISGAHSADYSETDTCVGHQIGLNATCVITITYSPTVVGSEAATLTINDNTTSTPQLITLGGIGAAPVVSGGPVITASSMAVPVGTSVTLTSNVPVTWALTSDSSGTVSGSSSTSITYTAPSTATPPDVYGGCMTVPMDSVFATRIDNLPVESRSAAWTAFPGIAMTFEPLWGTNIVDNTLTPVAATFFYSPNNNGYFQLPPAPARFRESGGMTTGGDHDHHMITINHQTCKIYETYQEGDTRSDGLTAQSGATFSGLAYNSPGNDSNGHGGATDAAGLCLECVTTHLSEIQAGVIKHAMRFTLAGGYISNQAIMWPATAANGASVSPSINVPYGVRYRLKASFNVTGISSIAMVGNGTGYTSAPTVGFTGCTTTPVGTAIISGGLVQGVTLTSSGSGCTSPTITFTGGGGSGASATTTVWLPVARILLTALQQYGVFIADAGPSGSIQMDGDTGNDIATAAAMLQITNTRGLPLSQFEAVDESSLMIGVYNYQVNPTNTYVTTAPHAIINATDSSSRTTTTALIIQPVTVGVQSDHMTFFAGGPSYQLTAWVNGSTNSAVTWTEVSGLGSITTGGIYTPPTSATSPSAIILKATSVADSTASTLIYGEIAPTVSGGLRVDVGNTTATYTDSQSNVWQPDLFFGNIGANTSMNQGFGWGNISDSALFATYKYTYSDDFNYGPFVLANGNYKITWMYGQAGCNGTIPTGAQAPYALGSQGQTQDYVDILKATNDTCHVPVTQSFPATVSNNLLNFSVRSVTGYTGTTTPAIGAYSILPDTTPAHIAIDTSYTTAVANSGTLQLYAVGWYMSNSVTWAVTGGGTISSSGLYTAPSTGSGTATFTATSTVDNTKTATASLTY